jgi:hypothetical protein
MYELDYAISTTEDGNMSFRHGAKSVVIENRKNFLRKNGFLLEDTVCMRVEMKDNIAVVDSTDKGKGVYSLEDVVRCDALVTYQQDLVLFLTIADCLPISIIDVDKGVLAMVHGGWPNTDLHIVEKVIDYLKKRYDCNPKDLEIVIGPGIQKDSLIYDSNILEKTASNWGKFIKKLGNDKYSIDNLGFTLEQLKSCRIEKNNIKIHDVDTFEDEKYFSHVRDYRMEREDQGRFCMIAAMRGVEVP